VEVVKGTGGGEKFWGFHGFYCAIEEKLRGLTGFSGWGKMAILQSIQGQDSVQWMHQPILPHSVPLVELPLMDLVLAGGIENLSEF
jgi:hypothetical protein